jgi:DNA-binding NtrC family response regulator
VRELENVLGHASMMTMGDTIDVQDLPPYLRSSPAHAFDEGSAAKSTAPAPEAGTLEEQERMLIVRALEAAGGNQSKAARALRIGRDALRYKLKKHNLETTRLERDSATAE